MLMPPDDELALPVSLLYSELHDLSATDAGEARREGGFAAKTINGRTYWYHQIWVGPARVQRSLGRESRDLLDKIEGWKKEAALWRLQNGRRRQLVRALKAAARMTTDRLTGKVIARLAELGVFGAGAILIGTHAYATYGPMLGVRLAQANLRTHDIDFGAVELASANVEVSFADAVQSADNAFFVVPARPGSRISTALKYRGGEARVELLTPLKTGRAWEPQVIKSLKFGAQKVPYLDYLIDEPVEATYLTGAGVRVTVPHPARFAWHKLIVAANRDVASHAKAMKDAAQAAELLTILLAARPHEVKRAADQLVARGGAYLKTARGGAKRLDGELRKTAARYLAGE
jgi:hypothetical protein